MDVAHGIEETQHDEVGRGADGGQDTADGAGVGRHQHEARGVFVLVEVNLPAIGGKHFLDGSQKSQADGEHHGSGGGVADPAGAEGSRQAHGQENPLWIRAHPLTGKKPVGKPLVQAVGHHGLGQDEAAHEEEDHGVGKGRKGRAHRHHAGDDRKGRPDERGDGDGHRLRDPPEGHQHHDGQKLMSLEGQTCDRSHEDQQRQDGGTEEPDSAPLAVKGFFCFFYCFGFRLMLVQIVAPPSWIIERKLLYLYCSWWQGFSLPGEILYFEDLQGGVIDGIIF